MRRPSNEVIQNALLKLGVSQSTATTASLLSEGSLRRAFEILASGGEQEEFSSIFMVAMRNAFARRISDLKGMSDQLAGMGREKSLRLLDYFARMTRENFIANLCIPPLNVMTTEEETFSSNFAPYIHIGNVERIQKEIDSAKLDISRNANSKLVWFDFLLQLMLLLRIKKPN